MPRYLSRTSRLGVIQPEESDRGLRPSVQRLVDLVDLTDPAWPHIAAVLQEFVAAGIEPDESTIPLAVKLGRQRQCGAVLPDEGIPEQATLRSTPESIVYYIRRGDLIKIGTTVSPYTRFRDLVPDEILAYEPGTRAEEKVRHQLFAHLRCSGEYFRDDPELRDHTERLRCLHGDPDPSWPTTANLGQHKYAQVLPPVTSGGTISAAEAEGELGIKKISVTMWVRRGVLPLAGYDDHGRMTYYREHLILLRDGFLQGGGALT